MSPASARKREEEPGGHEEEDETTTKSKKRTLVVVNEDSGGLDPELATKLPRRHQIKTDEDFLLKSGCARIHPANQFQHGCLHDMVCPENYQPSKKKMPKVPAKKYPFELDTFQEQSVLCLERQESVLVSRCAHIGRENGRRGIRHRDGKKRRAESGVHESSESVIESEVSRVEGGVFGRRVDDGRYGYKSQRELFGDDDGGVKEHVV